MARSRTILIALFGALVLSLAAPPAQAQIVGKGLPTPRLCA